MPTCLTHNQSYNPDEYCVYCGAPQTFTIAKRMPATCCSSISIIPYDSYTYSYKDYIRRNADKEKPKISSLNYLSPED